MNTIQINTAKYVPRIIQYEGRDYIGFINEKEEKRPQVYLNFTSGRYQNRSIEKACAEDKLYKISPILYFRLSFELRKAPHKERYNLNKLRYELNHK